MKYRQTKVAYIVAYVLYKWFVACITLGYIAVYDYYRYKRHSITLTEKAVHLEYGVFTRNSREVGYRSVQSVNVNQSILGQMFNYGDIVITTANQHESIVFQFVDSPQLLRQAIQDKVNN